MIGCALIAYAAVGTVDGAIKGIAACKRGGDLA